jgi:hypothetical protein
MSGPTVVDHVNEFVTQNREGLGRLLQDGADEDVIGPIGRSARRKALPDRRSSAPGKAHRHANTAR